MTQETSRLVLAVDSSQVRRATGDLTNMGRVGQNAAEGLSGTFASFRVAALAGAAAAGVIVRAVVQQADAYKNLNARLQLATQNSRAFAAAQTAVFDIAQRTGTGLEQTADLFGSLSRSTEALGVSQERVLGVTRTINQALVVSGTSAASASAALVQLGQGFASGTLRGEELNSVLEQAPRLARAIADGLGVTVGQLRALGQEGKLTADQVFGALERSGASIDREFSQIPLTVGRASTEAANAILKLIGTIDQASGATSGLAGAISGTAAAISQFADDIARVSSGAQDVGLLAEAFVTLLETLRVLGANAAFILQGIGREIGAVAAQVRLIGEVLAAPPAQLLETARRNWLQFNAISEAVKADGVKAREELDRLERRLLQRVALPDLGQTDRRELARRGRPSQAFGAASSVTPAAAGGSSPRVSEAQRYLESLQQQLQNTRDLSVAETVLADIQAGRLGKVTDAQRAALLGVAAQIDAAKRLQDQLQAEAAQEDALLQAQRARAEEARQVFEATRTPAEQLASEIERLNGLLAEGAISWDTYSRAQIAAQERFDDATKTIEEQAQQTDTVARDLGLTFSSAFEDAIVGGNSLRDVLKGLEQDILRIITRRLVTEPLGDAITGLIGGATGSGLGSLFGGLFGGGGGGINGGAVLPSILRGGAATGSNYVERDMFTILHEGEAVIPKAYNPAAGGRGGQGIVINQSFAPGTDRQTINQAAERAGRAVRLATTRNG